MSVKRAVMPRIAILNVSSSQNIRPHIVPKVVMNATNGWRG